MSGDGVQVALITGGASGLGAELARQLVHRGATVYVADLNGEHGTALVDAIREKGGRADMIELDVSDAEAVSHAVRQVVDAEGRLDLMINNAGYSVSGEIQHLRPEDWQRITAVNFLGVVHGSAAAYEVMRSQGSGRIVNIASVFGWVSAPVAAAYVATKHAVVGYTRSLRCEAEEYGVRVSLVCPGFIDTQLFENATYVGVDKATMLNQLKVPLMPVDRAARRILKGIDRNQEHIVFPWSVFIYRFLDRHFGFVLKWIYRKALAEHRQLKDPSDGSM